MRLTALVTVLLSGTLALADGGSVATRGEPQIQWFGTLEPALAEAKRTNRPILMTSAAPACSGVSGIW